ncbi:OmpA family protein [Sanyastnella coralliicola]|uniref:OmpA family protein n=1 Tax=Sanyastnella coralliicola TaxID=3069118 RepID=UPI0027B9F1AD|nr:OmpA family protein [Longitalea sp. SCSIO 12813]
MHWRTHALYSALAILFTCFTIIVSAQPGRYSISDKKSIKMYEEAVSAYEMNLDREAEQQINKAIERSPDFAEAYLLRAQINSDKKDMQASINDLREVTIRKPKMFPQTFFFLGDLLMKESDYADAKIQFEAFRKMGIDDPMMNQKADLMIASCDFAVEAMASPVPFDPVNLGPGVNSEAPEYFPCITADSQTFLYTRLVKDNRVRGGKQEDFYVSQRTNSGWGQGEPVREINSAFNEGAPTLSADGQMLIYTACESYGGDWGPYYGLGSCDLFVAQRVGGRWMEVQNIRPINSYDWDSQPSFSADGRTLYFIRGKHTGQGIRKQDIYYAQIQDDGNWSKPKRIPGEVNTPFEEESVMIHPDGETLFFSSNGHPGMGGLDIFMSKKQPDGSWGTPVNLGYPINTGGDENSLLVDAAGVAAYFASDREGGYGDLDLYSFELPENVRPKAISYVTGEVYDRVSLRKLQAKVEVIDLESGQVVTEAYSDPETGRFLTVLPPGKDYAFNVARPDYLFFSQNFSLKNVEAGERIDLDAPLEKMKPGSKIVLNNVFFDTNSDVLKETSKAELNKLATMMEQTPSLKIEIGGHTDNVGSDQDNQSLSERRAASVVSYLVSKGIAQDRLTSAGYGETQPVASNETDAGRAQNRRTEMKILGR